MSILVEHRRTLFSELSEVREFAPGATIADIVAQLPVVAEFATHGAVYLKASREDPGHVVPRENWHRVRPKRGTALFVSVVPSDGGNSKNVFTAIAAIALIALTAWVGGGGLGTQFLSGAFSAGTPGAAIAAAAIGVAGSAALGMLARGLTPDSPGDTTGERPTLGVAGITQNTIRPFRQVPAPLGKIRISPPLLARPFTTVEKTDQYVHVIVGVCGSAKVARLPT